MALNWSLSLLQLSKAPDILELWLTVTALALRKHRRWATSSISNFVSTFPGKSGCIDIIEKSLCTVCGSGSDKVRRTELP